MMDKKQKRVLILLNSTLVLIDQISKMCILIYNKKYVDISIGRIFNSTNITYILTSIIRSNVPYEFDDILLKETDKEDILIFSNNIFHKCKSIFICNRGRLRKNTASDSVVELFCCKVII